MQNEKKNRKALVVGIIAAVAILAVLLGLLLTQCTGGETAATTTTAAEEEGLLYDLYWNLDRQKYIADSESGLSTRTPEEDGYYHVRFFLDGEEITLKVKEKKLVNRIDFNYLMALEFDEDGIVVGVLAGNDLSVEKPGWEFYVQSVGGKLLKLNSAKSMNGMEVALDLADDVRIYDMSGESGPVGSLTEIYKMDRVYAIVDQDGKVVQLLIYERPNYMLTHEGECPHCKKTVTWGEWTRTDELPTVSGHYQLQNDVTVTAQHRIEAEQDICLDLNGKLVTNDQSKGNIGRIYASYNTGIKLALMDNSEEKTGTIKAVGEGDQGMCFWVRFGEFHMYDITMDASEAISQQTGTAFCVSKDAYAYMHSGQIIGGTAKTYVDSKTGKTMERGAGSVCVIGKFVMHGGTISGGYANALVKTANDDGTPSSYSGGYGGNIFINNGAVMEMNGGTVKNGKTGHLGGNIYLSGGAELIINGGTISGGQALGNGCNGGNIYVNPKAKLVMRGGSVVNGSCTNLGGNIFINSAKVTISGGVISGGRLYDWATKKLKEDQASRNISNVNGTINMSGGRVAGGVHMLDSKAGSGETLLSLSGSAVIFDEKGGSNLTLAPTSKEDCVVKVGNLSDRAKIGVTTVQNPIFTKPTQEKNADNFVSAYEGAEIQWTEEGLLYGRLMCVCGGKAAGVGDHKCESIAFSPVAGVTQLPKTGSYFLCEDLVLSKQAYHNAAGQLNIDLNGHSITFDAQDNKDGRIFHVFKDAESNPELTINLTDTVGGGQLKLKSNTNDTRSFGALVWIRNSNAVFNLYAGTLDATGIATSSGAAVQLTSGKFNMYGGEIKGGKAAEKGGGAVYLDANTVFNMYGGKIEGGTAAAIGGGAVYVGKKSAFNLYDGTVSGGQATGGYGGNFRVLGTLNMDGGAITGGYAKNNGGNIYVADKTAKVDVSGGEISYGGSANVGGNIWAQSEATLEVSGTGKIYGGYIGTSDSPNYAHKRGNIGIYGANAKLSGGTVSGLEASNKATVTLSGNAKVDTYTDPATKQKSIGLYLDGVYASIDDSKGAFEGSIAVSTVGYITNETKEAYVSKFASLTESISANYYNNKVFIGRAMCVCGGKAVGVGDHKCEDVTWSALKNVNQLPKKGNYFLTTDLTLTKQAYHNQVGELNIDLNGHSITYQATDVGARMFHGYKDGKDYQLTIGLTDSVGGGVLKIEGKVTDKSIGAMVWLSQKSHVFNLYSGVLDASNLTSNAGGTAVCVTSGQFNMYGGQIKGGTATADGGGAVYINTGAVFNLYSGTVSGGQATGGYGGNIRVLGTLNVAGGTITGGYAKNNGGNIYVANKTAKLTVSGGEISHGHSANVGGNIWAQSSATMEVSGGKIYGGYIGASDNPNYAHQYSNTGIYGAVVELSGGTVSSLGAASGATVTLSGDAVINTYTDEESSQTSMGLHLNKVSATIDDSEEAFTGKIAVTSTGYITNKTDAKYVDNFKSTTGLNTFYHDEKIYIGEKSPAEPDPGQPLTKMACICGDPTSANNACADAGHVQIEWTLWTGTTLPTTTGNYFLKNDLTLDAAPEVTGTVNVDLNGKTVSGKLPVVKAGAVLNLANHTDTAAVVSATGGMTVEAGATASIYDGITVSGSVGSCAGMIDNYGSVYVYGGSITGFRAVFLRTATSSLYVNGGILTGTTGNSVYNNGVAVIEGNAVVNGGTVAEKGGAIYNSGTMTIGGNATITGGNTTSGNGGNIYLAKGTLNVTGGKIVNGYAKNVGGNIFVDGNAELNISGGQIYGGSCQATPSYSHNCANIQVYKGTVKLSGGTVSGIYLGANGNLILSGDAVINTYTDEESGETSIGLMLTNPVTVDDSQEDFTGMIAVYNSGYITNETDAKYVANFKSTAGLGTFHYNGKIYISKDDPDPDQPSANMACLCGDPASTGNACADAGHVQIQWTEWNETTFPTATGNYILQNALTLTAAPEVTGTVNVDLNGKTVSGPLPAVKAGAVLNLVNHKKADTPAVVTANGGMKIEAGASVSLYDGVAIGGGVGSDFAGMIDNYGVMNMYGGLIQGFRAVFLRTATSSLYVNGGTLTGTTGNTVSNNGGTVKIEGNATVNGGTVSEGGAIYNTGSVTIGGNATVNGGSTTNGGAIYNTGSVTIGGNATVNGGSTTNGGAIYNTGTVEIKDKATITGGTATSNGGSIYNAGTVEIKDNATVTGGTASSLGGNIFLAGGSTLNVSGGAITGGKANFGGNIILRDGAALNVSGGKIYGGAAKNNGSDYAYNNDYANVQVSKGTVKLTGGEVSGIYLAADGTLTLSGGAVINTHTEGEQTSIGLKLISPATVDVTNGAFTGKVAVSGTAAANGKLVNASDTDFHTNFESKVAGKVAVYDTADKCIYLREGKYMCVCGDASSTGNACADAGHKQIFWTPWSQTSFPTTTGNYTLQNALTLDAAPEVTGFVCIDLNGKAVSGKLPVVKNGAVLNLANHKKADGVVSVSASAGITIEAGGNVSLYDGIAISGSVGGLAGMIDNYGDMNVYGGSITGFRAVFLRTATSYLYANNGTLAGTTGNTVYNNGGTVEIEGNAVVNGGTVAEKGGAIYSTGTVTIGGDATITGGKTTSGNGGNIYLAGGTLNVTGGKIVNGYAYNVGGNIFVDGNAELNVSGGEIYGGSCQATPNYSHNCANVQVFKGTVNLSGGTVSGIFVRSSTGFLNLSGGAVINTYTHIETDSETGNEVKQNSVGLYLGDGVHATIVDSEEEPFTGSIAVTTTGQITTATKEDYKDCFTSLVSGKSPVYETDGTIWIK